MNFCLVFEDTVPIHNDVIKMHLLSVLFIEQGTAAMIKDKIIEVYYL